MMIFLKSAKFVIFKTGHRPLISTTSWRASVWSAARGHQEDLTFRWMFEWGIEWRCGMAWYGLEEKWKHPKLSDCNAMALQCAVWIHRGNTKAGNGGSGSFGGFLFQHDSISCDKNSLVNNPWVFINQSIAPYRRAVSVMEWKPEPQLLVAAVV